MAQTTTTAGVLTIHSEKKMKVNDQLRGKIKRTGRFKYEFEETPSGRHTLPEQACLDLTQPSNHGKIYANGHGVYVWMYIKHAEYSSNEQLAIIILEEITALTKQLVELAAKQLINQIKQIWL